MQIKLKNHGFTLIEFFLSIIALFLLLIITYPIMQELTERNQIRLIKENLNLIRSSSKKYFEENSTNSVSLYEFVGPRKLILELEIIADEEYAETIFRDEEISAYSKKYGTITAQ